MQDAETNISTPPIVMLIDIIRDPCALSKLDGAKVFFSCLQSKISLEPNTANESDEGKVIAALQSAVQEYKQDGVIPKVFSELRKLINNWYNKSPEEKCKLLISIETAKNTKETEENFFSRVSDDLRQKSAEGLANNFGGAPDEYGPPSSPEDANLDERLRKAKLVSHANTGLGIWQTDSSQQLNKALSDEPDSELQQCCCVIS